MYMRNLKAVGAHKAFITKPTRHGKRFMEEDGKAMRLLREYRTGGAR